MFIGRENELKELNKLYDSNKFQCVVMYGRRRVGKTTLINEFISDKDAIVFTGLEIDSGTNLENLSKSILTSVDPDESILPTFKDYQETLDYVYKIAQKKKIIFVIDEYPYLAKSYPGISSILQVQIDYKFKNTNIFIILCGSSMSFMENQVLGYQSPLYGRRTSQFKITPFDFFETRKYFKKFNSYDLAVIYGITGGTPQYLAQINEDISLEENIKESFLSPTSFLFEEPLNLLKQEVREPSTYSAVIKAIATGSSRNSEIATKTHLSHGNCTEYLNNLISLGIIKKETPITNPSPQKVIYSIEDNLFRFWYKFIPDNISQLQKRAINKIYNKIKPYITDFMGKVFEEICKQYLWKLNIESKILVDFTDLGRFWGNDPINKCETEIDILAHEGKEKAIFAECKWTNEDVNTKVLEKLIQQSKIFNYKENYFYIFSKKGFTKSLIEKAQNDKNIKLVSFEDMF